MHMKSWDRFNVSMADGYSPFCENEIQRPLTSQQHVFPLLRA